MATPRVQSGNLRLTLNDARIFTSIDSTLTIDRATEQRAVNKDQDAGSFTKGDLTWNVSGNALATYGGDEADKLNTLDLFNMINDESDDTVEVEWVPSEDDAAEYLKGQAIMTNLTASAAVNVDGTVSFTLQGTDKLERLAIAGAPDIDS